MKRFWKEVSVTADAGGFRIALDGRPIRTQGGAPQVLPNAALAEALAQEWRAQGEEVDPRSFMLRDLADLAIDEIAPSRPATIARLLAYGETDTLCYRADPDEALYRRQMEMWEPVLSAFEEQRGIRFTRISGIVHRPQPAETMERLRSDMNSLGNFELAALSTLAPLGASLVVGLAALSDDAEPTALFDAANCEQDWQASLWGWDGEAERSRAVRLAAFLAAARFARLARS